MKKTLFIFFIPLFFISCSFIPKSKIDLSTKHSWKRKVLVFNPELSNFRSEGELSLRVKGKHYNVVFEMLSKDENKWRLEILGPFSIHLATIIINNNKASVFHDDKWTDNPWNVVSQSTFGVYIPAKILSAMVNGKFEIDGECTQITEGTLCKENTFYYYLINKKGILEEIRSVNVYFSRKKNRWVAVKNMKKSFEMTVKTTQKDDTIKDSLFQKPKAEEKNPLDEI